LAIALEQVLNALALLLVESECVLLKKRLDPGIGLPGYCRLWVVCIRFERPRF